jgi:hypothetical protein
MRESTLKVCFILDCTASMGPWIKAAKNRILEVLDKLRNDNPNFKIYASFIGYRDFKEEWFYVDFTQNYGIIHNALKDIQAFGGEDEAEDVSGAYDWVSKLNWSADLRSIFHITDAPNHGLAYHDDTVSDDYPEGHPYIDLRKIIVNLAVNNIDLTVFQITMSTRIMYNIMKDIYTRIRRKGFQIVNFMNSNQTPDQVFYHQVSSQLNQSMSQYDPVTD